MIDTLLDVYASHCFWLSCTHVERALTPTATHDAMEHHYATHHQGDLARLFPQEHP